jgi:hypothetical protein
MLRHKPQRFYNNPTMKAVTSIPPSQRNVLRDSGIGILPHIPSNLPVTPQRPIQRRNAFQSNHEPLFQTPSPSPFHTLSRGRTSSPRPSMDALKTPKIPSVQASPSSDIDPFAARPRIPRGESTFTVYESPSGHFDSPPITPIAFRRPRRIQTSDSSSEEFSYGVWGSYPGSPEKKNQKAVAVKQNVNRRSKMASKKVMQVQKQHHLQGDRKIDGGDLPMAKLVSVPSFEGSVVAKWLQHLPTRDMEIPTTTPSIPDNLPPSPSILPQCFSILQHTQSDHTSTPTNPPHSPISSPVYQHTSTSSSSSKCNSQIPPPRSQNTTPPPPQQHIHSTSTSFTQHNSQISPPLSHPNNISSTKPIHLHMHIHTNTTPSTGIYTFFIAGNKIEFHLPQHESIAPPVTPREGSGSGEHVSTAAEMVSTGVQDFQDIQDAQNSQDVQDLQCASSEVCEAGPTTETEADAVIVRKRNGIGRFARRMFRKVF